MMLVRGLCVAGWLSKNNDLEHKTRSSICCKMLGEVTRSSLTGLEVYIPSL